ncbi:ATP-binding protein [Roseomonas sp. GCM10028921]
MRALRFLPLSVRLPLLTGLVALVSCVLTSGLGFHFMSREVRHQAQNLADTYLDSLSSAAVQALQSRNIPLLQDALDTALGFQVGVVDRIIAVGQPDGTVLARAGAADAEPPMSRGLLSREWEPSADGGSAWAQREVFLNGEVTALVAVQLAFPNLVERRQALFVRMAFATLFATAASAGIAIGVARRVMEPVLAVTRTLEGMAAGHAPTEIRGQSENERLAGALEMLIARLREREELAARLAERERIAVLGRLAATVAHEVRNPLAGMLTSIDTIRHYGADEAVRQRSLDLVERGLHQIETVVRTTLAAHREEDVTRATTADDLDDLRLLVGPEACRRGVQLAWRSEIGAPFPADAVRLRQILLNLLLNAVAATPPEGKVSLRAAAGEEWLMVEVEDEGGGLPALAHDRLSGVVLPPAGDGIGLEVAARLATVVRGLITAEQRPKGSLIVLRVPVALELRSACCQDPRGS